MTARATAALAEYRGIWYLMAADTRASEAAIMEHTQDFPPYRWAVKDAAPLTPLAKPLGRSTIALLTSGGVSHRDVKPFNPLARTVRERAARLNAINSP